MENRKLKPHQPNDRKLKIHTQTDSDRTGLAGWFERTARRFKGLAFVVAMLPLVFVFVFCMSASIYPGILVFKLIDRWVSGSSIFIQAGGYALSFAIAYVLFAVTIIFLVPAVNFILPLKVRESRGNWYSLPAIPWYYHNALVQFVRYTVLDMITPTPLNILFYKMMGMKIGKNCIINTTNISDPCLIEIGDYVTIGGSATIFAHYGQGGFLVIGKTKIGSYTTIGLKASVMGCVTIGENCVVGPHVAILPKTVMQDQEKILK